MIFFSIRATTTFLVGPIILSATLCASMISRNAIAPRLHEEAREYLSSRGYPFYSIPPRIMPEYNLKIETTLDTLLAKIDREQRTYADSEEVKYAIKNVMQEFIDKTLITIVLRDKIDLKTREIIRHVALQNNIYIDHLTAEMQAELHSRTEKIISHLKLSMHKDARNYVRTHEIESVTKKELQPLFERIKYDQQADNANAAAASASWASLFGSLYSPTSQAAPADTPDIVYVYELQKNVFIHADAFLKKHGSGEAVLPTRLIGLYADTVQMIINTLEQKMNWLGNNFITKRELINETEKMMQPVLDKLRYVHETCPICLDEYVKKDHVGHLSCNHFFHKDCIETWLNKQATCPLCRAPIIKIHSVEVVL